MTYHFPPDIEKLLRDQMAMGSYVSEDEVIRDALRALGEFVHSPEEVGEEYRQTVTAVQEGMADAEAGRMRALRDVINEARGKGSAGADS